MSEGFWDPLPDAPAEPPKETATWMALMPVPKNALDIVPKVDSAGRSPSLVHEYRDRHGDLLGFIMRFETPEGGKEFRPLTYCQHRETKKLQWRWQSWQTPRPLYRLDELHRRKHAPVVICEGEKAADKAAILLPAYVSVTSPNGSKSGSKADWRDLANRNVLIWPDNDEAGELYADAVDRELKKIGVIARFIIPPADKAEGWDADDALKEGWTPEQAAELADKATTARHPTRRPPKADKGGSDGGGGRTDPAELIDDVELWHDVTKRGYASAKVGEHYENFAISSKSFRIFLSGVIFTKTGQASKREELDDAVRLLEARAIFTGPCYQVWRRTGRVEGKFYLDLGGEDWRAVEIDAEGWRIIERAPIKFVRSSSMEALPQPEQTDFSIEDHLKPFVHLAEGDQGKRDFRLIVSWLIACYWPKGPYPILSFNGVQGASKSSTCRFLRALVDPNIAPVRAMPENLRDLVVAADNSWMLAFDNVSGVQAWVSDALCRLATGAGFATRELHSDREEAVFYASRPVLLNGIPDMAGRPDLQDRTIGITLAAVPETMRKEEDEINAEFSAAVPRILGALMQGLSSSIRNRRLIKLATLPRMADFAKIAAAAAEGLGWTADEFLDDYTESRANGAALSLEASVLASVIIDYAKDRSPSYPFVGTSTDLKATLEAKAPLSVQRLRSWPQSPSQLGSELKRLTPALASIGIVVEQIREGKERTRKITLYAKQPRPGREGGPAVHEDVTL